jgi:hypothetical protein
MIPLNLVSAIHESLREDRRPPDGLLHCSGDLVGSLRHSMLRAAGAPTVESELISDIRLMTGTFWHRYVGSVLVERGVPFMQEVRLDKWLPEGWAGTADWLFWNEDYGAFALGDLKTTKGEAMKFIGKDGVKPEHLWQLSAYWHALHDAGIPLITGIAVLYLPMNNTQDKQEQIEPILHECDPLSREVVHEEMERRWAATKAYLASLDPHEPVFVNEHLAPEQERVQKLWWNKTRQTFDVKLVRHWSADFCPYPNELCACSEAPQEKIGEYRFLPDSHVEYVPRNGREHLTVSVAPTQKEIVKRWKEVNGS